MIIELEWVGGNWSACLLILRDSFKRSEWEVLYIKIPVPLTLFLSLSLSFFPLSPSLFSKLFSEDEKYHIMFVHAYEQTIPNTKSINLLP